MQKVIVTILFSIGVLCATAQSIDSLKIEIESSLKQEYWKLAERNIELLFSQHILPEKEAANYHHNLALCKLQIKDYLGAQDHLIKALTLKEKHIGVYTHEYATTAHLMGDLSLQIGDYDRAKEYFTKVVIIEAKENTESDAYVEALIGLGQFYESMGLYTEAHNKFESALSISEKIHHAKSPEYASVLNHVGRIYVLNNEVVAAESTLLQANAIYLALGSAYQIPYVESLENLAMLYEHKGDFSQAEKLLLSIEREKRALGGLSEELLLETLNDLGILYLDMNILDRSRKYFEEVERISKYHLGTEHKYYATAINNMAAICKESGEYEKSKELLERALEIYLDEFGQNHPNYANALNNLASVERQMGLYNQSEAHYTQVLEIDKNMYGKNHPGYATTINNLGILYSTMGEHTKAGQYYRLALDIRKATLGLNHPLYAKSLENLGLHHYVSGSLTLAERCLKEAIDIRIAQISTIFPTLTEHERSAFYNQIRDDVERYAFIAYQLLEQNPDLIQNILNHQIATAGILFSSSERIRNAVYRSKDAELIEQYSEWTAAKQRVAGYYQLGDQRLNELGISLSEEETKIEQMEKRMMFQSGLFSSLVTNKSVGWKDVRRSLNEKEALVQVIRFREFDSQSSSDGAYFGFTDKVHYMYVVVKHDTYLTPAYVVVQNGAALEKKGFSLYNNSVKYENELQSSYLNYWSHLEPLLQQAENVFMVPDGVYFKLNPNILKINATSYVFDQYHVRYLSNSRDLMNKKLLLPAVPKVTLIGNPSFGKALPEQKFDLKNLPGAQKEVDELAQMLSERGWDVKKLTGEEATESRVSAIQHPSVLRHCHRWILHRK